MKFHLIKNYLFPLNWKVTNEKFTTFSWETQELTKCQEIIIGNVNPVSKSQLEKAKCAKLERKLGSLISKENNSETEIDYLRWGLQLELGVSEIQGPIGSTKKGYIALKSLQKEGWLCAIQKASENLATIIIELSLRPREQERFEWRSLHLSSSDFKLDVPHAEVFTREMRICEGELPSCIDTEIHYPHEYKRFPHHFHNALAICTVTVNIPDTVLEHKERIKHANNLLATTVPELNKKILDEEILADVKIFLANGTCIPAHKSFLASQSPVFYSMFTSDMTENRESKVEIPDMSEDGMRAFLRYLYYQDESVMNGGIEQVVEVYKAAHKYHVRKLELLLRNRILEQPTAWFEIDESLKLFVFVQNVTPVDEELRAKIVEVLKTLMKNAKDSEIYQKLLCDHPAAAVELCKLTLSSGTEL